MSILAFNNPRRFIKNIFFDESKEYNEMGIYTVMFFVNNVPTVVTIDDCFPTINGKSAFVSVDSDPNDGVK
jgi:hypothetical protein